MNKTTLGFLTAAKDENIVKLKYYTYMTTSLEHLIRFLDHLQQLFDDDAITHQFRQLGLEEEDEGQQGSTRLLERKIEKTVDKKLGDTCSNH